MRILAYIAIGAIGFAAVMGLVGFVLTRIAKKRGENTDMPGVTENVADLRDRFNRARYMDEDGR